MQKIILRGSKEGTEVTFDPKLHVVLTDGCYEKNDTENVVRVSGRYYRRNSPLVTELSHSYYGRGNFALTEDCTEDFATKEMVWAVDTTSVSGDYVFLERDQDGDWSFKPVPKDARIYNNVNILNLRLIDWRTGEVTIKRVFDRNTSEATSDGFLRPRSGNYFLAKDTVTLHHSYGGTFAAAASNNNRGANRYRSLDAFVEGELLNHDGGYHYVADIEFSVDPNGVKYKPIKNSRTGFVIDPRPNPFYSSDQLDHTVRSIMVQVIDGAASKSTVNSLLKNNWFIGSRVDSDFAKMTYTTKFGLSVGSKEDAKLIDKMYEVCESIYSETKLTEAIAQVNWFGKNHNEPIPSLFTNCSIGNQGGDYVYYKGKSDVKGNTYLETGGIGYTFGLEIETEKGIVPFEVAKLLKADCVGDRSISGLEYVTGVLAGDEGMRHVEMMSKVISQYAFVADSCGIHVHIGSDRGAWSPRFDKEFSVMAIMLGCKIEKELFSLLPADRMEKKNSNGQSYCGSIMHYSDITFKNWKNKLFHYVFDRMPEGASEEFSGLSSLIEARHHVGRWASGRYKWLNLINCVTDNSTRRNGGGFQTIEFRAFNGTLNFEDIKAFTLISLAFVSFIEQNRKDFEEKLSKVSLKNMVYSTMNEDACAFFGDWYRRKVNQVQQVIKPNVTQTIG